jgi:hypothetical protein
MSQMDRERLSRPVRGRAALTPITDIRRMGTARRKSVKGDALSAERLWLRIKPRRLKLGWH